MMTAASRFFFLFVALIVCVFFISPFPTLVAMDPDADETPAVTTPTAPPSNVPANNVPTSSVSASAAPAPVACAPKKAFQPLSRPDLCHIFDSSFMLACDKRHISFKDIETLKQFLDAVDENQDPFEQATPLCCNGFTIRDNLMWEVLEPQQDELFQRLKTYCHRTKRNLHLRYIRDSYKGEKNALRLFDLPITHFEARSLFILNPPLLEKCKDTLHVLSISDPCYGSINDFNVLTNLKAIHIQTVPFRNIEALKNCTKLHAAYLDGCVRLQDLTPLKDLPHLERLSLKRSAKVNIKPLLDPDAFPALRYLCLTKDLVFTTDDLAALQEKIEKIVILKPRTSQRRS